MPIRVQIAIEADTPKDAIVGLNEVADGIRKCELTGEIVRKGRHSWFRVDKATEASQPTAPEPAPEIVDVPVLVVPVTEPAEPLLPETLETLEIVPPVPVGEEPPEYADEVADGDPDGDDTKY